MFLGFNYKKILASSLLFTIFSFENNFSTTQSSKYDEIIINAASSFNSYSGLKKKDSSLDSLITKLVQLDTKTENLTTLSVQNLDQVLLSLKVMYYGLFFLDSSSAAVKTNLSKILQDLQNIESLNKGFSGIKRKLKISLDLYDQANLDETTINSPFSIEDIFGTSGQPGILENSVSRRMEDFKDIVYSTSGAEDLQKSWQELKSYVSKSYLVIEKFKTRLGLNSAQIAQKIDLLNSNLNKTIDFSERIAAISSLVTGQFIEAADLLKMVQAAEQSITPSVTTDSRQKMVSCLTTYLSINNPNLSNDLKSKLTQYINSFSKNVMASELFDNSRDFFCMQTVDSSKNFIVQESLSESDSRKVLKAGEQGLVGAVFLEVVEQNQQIFLRTTINNDSYYLKFGEDPATYNNWLELEKHNQSEVMASDGTIFQQFAFEPFTKNSSKDNISFKNIKAGGFITKGLDRVLRCKSISDGESFNLKSSSAGLEQEVKNSFRLVPVSGASKILDQTRVALMTDDALLKAADKAASAKSFIQALGVALGGISPSNPDEVTLFISELSVLINSAYLYKDIWNELKRDSQISTLDSLFKSLAKVTTFADQIKPLSDKWNDIKNSNFVEDVPDDLNRFLPQNGDSVAFSITSTSKNPSDFSTDFLIAKKIVGPKGEPVYTLVIDKSNPSAPEAQFLITREKSLFGISSKLSPNEFLTVVEAKDLAGADASFFVTENGLLFLPLANSESSKNISLKKAVNQDSQMEFLLKAVDKSKVTDNNIQIKFLSPAGGFLSRKQNIPFVSSNNADALSINVVAIKPFYSTLGSLAADNNELNKLSGMKQLIDIASSKEELTSLLLELKKYIETKKSSNVSWVKFKSQDNLVSIINDIITKCETILSNKFKDTELTSDPELKNIVSIKNNIKDSLTTKYTDVLEDFFKPENLIVLGWTGPDGKVQYLTADNTTLALTFSSESLANPACTFALEGSQSAGYKLKFVNFTDSKNAKLYLGIDPQNPSGLKATTVAEEFLSMGPINQVSFKSKSKGTFVNIANSKANVVLAKGQDNNMPIPVLQTFSIIIISDIEKLLVEARKLLDFNKTGWLTKADKGWTSGEEGELKTALTSALGFLSNAVALALDIDNPASESEIKTLLIEITSLINFLTSELNGKAYNLLVKDNQLRTILENTILLSLGKLSENNSSLSQVVNNIVALWQGGYTGEKSFKNGDVVFIKAQNQYLTLVNELFNGSLQNRAKGAPLYFSKSCQFKVFNYKGALFLTSLQDPKTLLAIPEVSSGDNVLTTISLSSEIESTDLSQDKFIPAMFYYDSEKSTLSGSSKKPNGDLAQTPIILVNTSNLITVRPASSSQTTNFKIQPLSLLDQKLTDLNLASSPKEALAILLELFNQNYLNNTNSTLFVLAVQDVFRKLKKDSTSWSNAISDKTVLSLMDQVSKAAALFTRQDDILKAISKDEYLGFEDLLDKFITISWTTLEGETHYLNRDGDTLKFKVTDKLDPKNLFNVDGTNDSFKLFVSENNKNFWLSINSSNALILSDNPGDAIELEIKGSPNKAVFKIKNIEPVSYLTISQDYNLITSAAVEIQNTYIPSFFQTFSLNDLSDVEEVLSKSREFTIEQQMTVLLDMMNQVQNSPTQEDISTVISGLDHLVKTITKDEALFDKISTDVNDSTIIKKILDQAISISQSYRNLKSTATDLKASWEEGFVGTLAEGLDLLSEKQVLVKINDTYYLSAQPEVVQGQSLTMTSAQFTEQVNPGVIFTLSNYKDKTGLKILGQKPLFLTCASATDKLLPSKNLYFSNLSSADQKFGSKDTLGMQFKLEKVTQTSSATNSTTNQKVTYKIKSIIFADEDKNQYLKIDGQDVKVNGLVSDAATIEFILPNPLLDRLIKGLAIPQDKDRVSELQQLYEKNYITDDETAILYSLAVDNFITSKTKDIATWEAFKANIDLISALGNLMNKIIKDQNANATLKTKIVDSLAKLEQGFKEDLPDDEYVQIIFAADKANPQVMVVQDNKLILIPKDQAGMDSIFKIKFLKPIDTNNKIINLIWKDDTDTEFYLSVLDDVTTNTFSKKGITIVKEGTQTDQASINFNYKGFMQEMSLMSVKTGGFITVDSDNSLSTLSGLPLSPAGILIDNVLQPGTLEKFSIKSLSDLEMLLITGARPKTAPQILEAIQNFIKYPSLYKKIQLKPLEKNAKDLTSFIDAVEMFVKNVVTTKEVEELLEKSHDSQFYSLINILNSLGLSSQDKTRLKNIYTNWIEGFALATELQMPDKNSPVMLFINNQTLAPTDSLADLASFSRVAYIKLDKATGKNYIVCTPLSLSEKYVDNDFDVTVNNFIIENDPFQKDAVFDFHAIREFVAFSYTNKAGERLFFNIDDLPTDFSKASLQDFSIYLGKGSLDKVDQSTNIAFVPAWSDSLKKSYALEHAKNQATVSINSQSGMLTILSQSATNAIAKNQAFTEGQDVVATNPTVEQKIVITPYDEFMKTILTVRNAADIQDEAVIKAYQKAFGLIKTDFQIQLYGEELLRFCARKQVNKSSWNKFVAQKSICETLSEIIKSYLDQTSSLNSFKKLKDVLKKQILYLSQQVFPKFKAENITESYVLSFSELFDNLRYIAESLDDSVVEKFVSDIEGLFTKRSELNLGNASLNANENFTLSKDVASWIEFYVLTTPSVKANSKMQEKLMALKTKFNTDFTYSEIINNLLSMLKISSFSRERFELFMTQLLKAGQSSLLQQAFASNVSIKDIIAAVSAAKVRQLRPFAQEKIPATWVIPDWLQALKPTTVADLADKYASNIKFDLGKGQTYMNNISSMVSKLSQIKDDLEIEKGLANFIELLGMWNDTIGDKLQYSDVSSIFDASRYRGNNDTEKELAALKAAKVSFVKILYRQIDNLYKSQVYKQKLTDLTDLDTQLTTIKQKLSDYVKALTGKGLTEEDSKPQQVSGLGLTNTTQTTQSAGTNNATTEGDSSTTDATQPIPRIKGLSLSLS